MEEDRLFVDIRTAGSMIGASVYDADAKRIGIITDIESRDPFILKMTMRIFDDATMRLIKDGVTDKMSVTVEAGENDNTEKA